MEQEIPKLDYQSPNRDEQPRDRAATVCAYISAGLVAAYGLVIVLFASEGDSLGEAPADFFIGIGIFWFLAGVCGLVLGAIASLGRGWVAAVGIISAAIHVGALLIVAVLLVRD